MADARRLSEKLCGEHLLYDCLYLTLADSLDTAVVTADQNFANKVADPARVVFVTDFLKA